MNKLFQELLKGYSFYSLNLNSVYTFLLLIKKKKITIKKKNSVD